MVKVKEFKGQLKLKESIVYYHLNRIYRKDRRSRETKKKIREILRCDNIDKGCKGMISLKYDTLKVLPQDDDKDHCISCLEDPLYPKKIKFEAALLMRDFGTPQKLKEIFDDVAGKRRYLLISYILNYI